MLVSEALRSAGPQEGNEGLRVLQRGRPVVGEVGTVDLVTDGLFDYSGLCSAPGPVLLGNPMGPFKLLVSSQGSLERVRHPFLEKSALSFS